MTNTPKIGCVNHDCGECQSPAMLVQLLVKDQYGGQVLYPHNYEAHQFANIAGTKTITRPVVKHILALGYTVEYVHGEVKL